MIIATTYASSASKSGKKLYTIIKWLVLFCVTNKNGRIYANSGSFSMNFHSFVLHKDTAATFLHSLK